MNTVCWIILGVIAVSLALYFIFNFVKKIELIQKISSITSIFAFSILYLLLLLNYIPDSIHTFKLALISFTLLITSYTISCFSKNKKLDIIYRVLFILSLFPLVLLYKSVFLIYHVPFFINIIGVSTYIVLLFLFFIIFIKKSSIEFYAYSIISLVLASFINYCSLLTLCYTPAPYSIVRFIGSLCLIGYLIFSMLNSTILNLKLKKLISFSILLASIVIIAFSNLMILY